MSTARKPSTYVKSFFAESIQAAMEEAQAELGPDALLLDSREAPPEARHLGDYEVVFGAGPDVPASLPATPPAAANWWRKRSSTPVWSPPLPAKWGNLPACASPGAPCRASVFVRWAVAMRRMCCRMPRPRFPRTSRWRPN